MSIDDSTTNTDSSDDIGELVNEDDLCVWKDREQDPYSTSFGDMKRLPEDEMKKHPLYPCIPCEGYQTTEECTGYYPMKNIKQPVGAWKKYV